MGFITRLLGVPQDVQEAITEKKAATEALKVANRTIADLRETIADSEHKTYRQHRLELRNADEDVEDVEYHADRKVTVAEEKATDAVEDAKRQAKREAKQSLDQADTKIAELKSVVRELELAAEEDEASSDLAIQEGILEYKEEHIKDVTALEVKLAEAKGQTLAAQADAKSKDQVIKVLTDLLEGHGEQVDSLIEAITEVAPKINLEKLGFEVTVPVAAKQGGGDNKQKQN